MLDIKKELQDYEQSDAYQYDFYALKSEYETQSGEIPSDEEMRNEVLEQYKKQLELRSVCEENGHVYHEENVDGENGCCDLVCERCEDSHHIQW